MKLKQILSWAAIAFVAFYLVTQPTAAGHLVHNILDGLKSAGNSLATFFNSICACDEADHAAQCGSRLGEQVPAAT